MLSPQEALLRKNAVMDEPKHSDFARIASKARPTRSGWLRSQPRGARHPLPSLQLPPLTYRLLEQAPLSRASSSFAFVGLVVSEGLLGGGVDEGQPEGLPDLDQAETPGLGAAGHLGGVR